MLRFSILSWVVEMPVTALEVGGSNSICRMLSGLHSLVGSKNREAPELHKPKLYSSSTNHHWLVIEEIPGRTILLEYETHRQTLPFLACNNFRKLTS
jgi:hypothetical protein